MKRRYDREYQEIFEASINRTWLNREALHRYQSERLRAFLRIAATAPFWSNRFSDYGINIHADDLFQEIAKLPILTKQEAREHFAAIRPKVISENDMHTCHTSGTTGSGLRFWETRRAEKERWANWWRYRSWHGVTQDTWCGYFGGRSLVPLTQQKPPFWRYNRPARQLMLSAYHLKPETAPQYIQVLRDRRIKWVHGYPSVLALLAGYTLDQKLDLGNALELITFGAESVLPQQKAIIERAFKVKMRQHYGQSEAVANISECEHGNLHVDEDYSFVEFLPIQDTLNSAKIIGTNWTNPAFPLIRYDVGDIAALTGETCSCGRTGRLVQEIDGRKEDYIVLPDGTHIGRLDHIFKDLINIREAQIYQKNHKEIDIRVAIGTNYNKSDEDSLIHETRKRLGDKIQIKIVYLDQIPKNSAGKLRFIVSDLKNHLTQNN